MCRAYTSQCGGYSCISGVCVGHIHLSVEVIVVLVVYRCSHIHLCNPQPHCNIHCSRSIGLVQNALWDFLLAILHHIERTQESCHTVKS